MAWQIEVSAEARRRLRKMVHGDAKRIRDYLRKRVAVLENPRQLGKPLKGRFSELWRYRVGDYRILCSIENDRLRILVVQIAHRGKVYR